MYQDIVPHIFDHSYAPSSPAPEDYIVYFQGNNILLKPDRTFFTFQDIDSPREMQYLFRLDDHAFYLSDLRMTDYISLDIRTFRKNDINNMLYPAVTAMHLSQWYRDNRFCGRCGNPLEADTKERAMRCPECGNLIYPRINPVVIGAVINDQNELLVTKYAHGTHHAYALVAGFIEIGESGEQALQREVKEETGLDITDIQYYGSQPWAFSSSFIVSYVAHAHGPQQIKLDTNELKSAEWVNASCEDIDQNDSVSITGEMIHAYFKGEIK